MTTQNFSRSPAEGLFFQADQEIGQGHFAEAKGLLEQALDMDPDFGQAYNHLGWLYETKYQDYKQAEECYRKALKLAPEYPPIYLNFSILLSTLEKNDELKKHLEQALQVPGINKSSIYNEQGVLYEREQNLAKAREFYEKALLSATSDQETQNFRLNLERCQLKEELLKN
jgi:Tfp pilus assembly protein PilF